MSLSPEIRPPVCYRTVQVPVDKHQHVKQPTQIKDFKNACKTSS